MYPNEVKPRFAISAGVALILMIVAAVAGGFAAYAYVGSSAANKSPAASTSTVTQTVISTGLSPSSNPVTSTINGTTGPASGANGTAASINSIQIYNEASQSVVTVDGFQATTVGFGFRQATEISELLGSGIVVNYNSSNYLVTNFHVVDGSTNMTVTFGNGDAYPATVVGTDPYSDVAILKAPSAPVNEFHPLSLSSSSSVQVGQPVAAIGNPFGLAGSITVGIVSQLGRTITEPASGNYSIAGIVQFSAPINPGNSGGPLLNALGQVIGMTTATVNGSQGVGFAIPSDTIMKEVGSLISTGSYNNHPYLGIAGDDMAYQLAQANGNNVTYGVLVENIVPGGPAQKAGVVVGTRQGVVEGQTYLLGGDVIVQINGTRIVNYDALASFMEENVTPGHVIMLGVMRGTTLKILPLTVGARPPLNGT